MRDAGLRVPHIKRAGKCTGCLCRGLCFNNALLVAAFLHIVTLQLTSLKCVTVGAKPLLIAGLKL